MRETTKWMSRYYEPEFWDIGGPGEFYDDDYLCDGQLRTFVDIPKTAKRIRLVAVKRKGKNTFEITRELSPWRRPRREKLIYVDGTFVAVTAGIRRFLEKHRLVEVEYE